MDEQMLFQHILPEDFYRTDGITLAKNLLGKVLVRRTPTGLTAGIISETEAYMGIIDKASHAYNGRRTQRTETMYLSGGYAYVYLIYGIYSCMNITANERDNPEAVLIRSVIPLSGFDGMIENYCRFNETKLKKTNLKTERFCKAPTSLTDGPGKLCAAMDIDRTLDKAPVFLNGSGNSNEIFVSDLGFAPLGGFTESKRIGIDYAEEAAHFPWRFTAIPPFESVTIVQHDGTPPNSLQ